MTHKGRPGSLAERPLGVGCPVPAHQGAGRPVLSLWWRLGPARFGSYRNGWGCFRIYRVRSMPGPRLGSYDRRHKLPSKYPSFFGRRVIGLKRTLRNARSRI
jgi:hypothetical protein